MTTPSAARIVQIATGYVAAKQLFAASRVGLFEVLEAGPLPADDIATATGVRIRVVRMLADAMAAKGLLVRTGAAYGLSEDAAAFLIGEGSIVNLAPFLEFLSEISYPQWREFSHLVDTIDPADLLLDDVGWATFVNGARAFSRLHALSFARLVDLSTATKVLDFGGLSPAFAMEIMRRNPALSTTFVYEEGYEIGVEEALAEAGLSDRADVHVSETASTRPPGAYDAVLVNHVVHRFSAEENQRIFRNVRAAAVAGATLTVTDFFLDDAPSRSVDELYAEEFFVLDGTAAYPEADVREWLEAAGWQVRELVALPGSARVLIATAI